MKPNRKQKSLALLLIGILIVIVLFIASIVIGSIVSKISNNNTTKTETVQKASSSSNTPIQNMPTQTQYQTAYYNVQSIIGDATYNGNGAYIVNNNKSTLIAKNSTKPFAANTLDAKGRPNTANAFLTKQTRQYKNREETNNGRTKWVPNGWHQVVNLPGKYTYAYNRGHLLAYALVGGIKKYDASESNKKNIITQTMWANQASTSNNTGQAYYETIVRKALDKNKKIRYQVRPLYGEKSSTNVVPYGVQIQAVSTDGTINFNVFIPNAQGNINVNYSNGTVTQSN
jgi:DNA-entry nuclease